jgi:hypothetical protein
MAPEDPPRSNEPAKLDAAVAERHRKELEAELDQRLRACLDAPDARERIEAVMDSGGRLKKRPIAGETF